MQEEIREKNIHRLLQLKYGIIGESKVMEDAMQLLMQAAPTDLAVMITGETGTGKEIFANALHGLSKRKKFPFVSVNCGAIPETLLESELFGHEKGAFTSANEQRKGFFEAADHGTIFLDEIGEMPVGTQVKLLRVLESGEFSRLGSSEVRRVDVRVVVATNRDLEAEIRKGNFRQDLFFRLNSIHIVLPPLRQHPEDIPLLVEYFAEKTCEKLALHYDGIAPGAVSLLRTLPWQGNVRELRNLIETLVTLEQATYITPEMIRRYIPRALPAHDFIPQPQESSLVRFMDYDEPKKFEMELIFRSILELKNDISEIKRNLNNINEKLENLNDLYYVNPSNIENITAEEITDYKEDDLNLEDLEKNAILSALRRFEFNRRLAAKALGISERTLYRKLEKYGMDKD